MGLQSARHTGSSDQSHAVPGFFQVSGWKRRHLKLNLPCLKESYDRAYALQPELIQEYLQARDDFELIDLTLNAVNPAFEVLVDRYYCSIYILALKMVQNHEDAVDIAQDVFLKAYESLSMFRKKSSFHTWLYRIATNSCINHLRKHNMQKEIELTVYHAVKQADTLDKLYNVELQDVVNHAIEKLPEKQKATVILRVCEGLSHREVAKLLRCSIGTAKANYFHAIRNLRRFMKHYIEANMDADTAIPTTLLNITHSLKTL